MRWKEIVGDYLSFTRKDRIAVLVIVFLLLAVFFLPKFITREDSAKPAGNDNVWITALNRLEQKQAEDEKDPGNAYSSSYYQYDRTKNNYYAKENTELFYFDPNTLSPGDWEKLGIRQKTIRTIQNYLTKGGRFRKPEDVKKIYGLFPDEYERIAPYIRIAANDNPVSETTYTQQETKPLRPVASRYAVIDINTADTTAFISLPGIGSKLASRIVNFRDKLGGVPFYKPGWRNIWPA